MAGLTLCATTSATYDITSTWYDWNEAYVASGTCTSATTLTAGTWAYWNAGYAPSTVSANDVVWYRWADVSTASVYRVPSSVPQITPEQVAENQRIAAERERRRVEVKERAKEILLAHLDRKQAEAFHKHQYFEVIARNSKRRYLVAHGKVFELNAKGEQIRSFCIHPHEAYPEYDNMLAKKILLEADEAEFLRIANATQLRAA